MNVFNQLEIIYSLDYCGTIKYLHIKKITGEQKIQV